MHDGDLALLCELCGPQASQLPTLTICKIRSFWFINLTWLCLTLKGENKNLTVKFFMLVYEHILKSIANTANFLETEWSKSK